MEEKIKSQELAYAENIIEIKNNYEQSHKKCEEITL